MTQLPDPQNVDAPPTEGPSPSPDPEPGPPAPDESATAPTPDPLTVQRSRLADLWVVLGFGAAIMVLLLVFVLQNGRRVEIDFYGAHGNAPLGVALLMAAAFGVLLVVVPGAGRIIQLKRAARRRRRAGGGGPERSG